MGTARPASSSVPIRPASQQEALANPHDGDAPPVALSRQWQKALLGVFVVGLVVSAAFAATDHWRRAAFLFGGCFLWLGGMRLTCDDAIVGLFSVRSRRFDVTFDALVGGALLFFSASVDALGS